MKNLHIWGRLNSINVQKVLWLCEDLKIPFERTDAGMQFGVNKTLPFLQLNPNGLVPVIKDNELVLWESHAILRYLSKKHDVTDTFYPKSVKKSSYKIPSISLCDQKIGTERQACLRIQNEELMHVKVDDFIIKVQNQQTTVVPTFLTILPKSYKDVNISIPRVAQPVTIEAKTSFGPASITLPVQFTQK